jgi:hypothetical protein
MATTLAENLFRSLTATTADAGMFEIAGTVTSTRFGVARWSCAKHAEHRNGVVNVDRDYRWNAAEVQDQLYATILVAQIAQRNTALLDIRLYLENHFSPSRLDLSTDLVLVTKEDRTAPAILAHRGNYFYESYGNDFAVARSQAAEVPKTNIACAATALNSEMAKQILKDIDLWDGNLCDTRLTKICKLVKDNENPYG